MTDHEQVPTDDASLITDIQQITDGDGWVDYPSKFFTGCCDCGLCHIVEIRKVGDQFQLRVERDPVRSAELRSRQPFIKHE